MNTEVFLDGLIFPEGPRWHNGKFWFSDMQGLHVMSVDPSGRSEKIIEVKGSPSGLGWLPDGRLQVVSMLDRRLLRLDAGGLAEVAYGKANRAEQARGRRAGSPPPIKAPLSFSDRRTCQTKALKKFATEVC